MDLRTNKLRAGLILAILLVTGWLGLQKCRGAWSGWWHDPADRISVLVADRYIQAYSVIRPEDVREQEFPKSFVPPGAVTSLQELQNDEGQRLFIAAIAVPEGHALSRALLVDAARKEALGSLVGPGKVAVSFEIDRAHGVGGWIKPGDTIAMFGAALKPRLLFPSILVLAVDGDRLGEHAEKKADDSMETIVPQEVLGASGPKVITVLASAREAASLIDARESGSFSIVLRSPGDDLPWPAEK